LFISCHFDLGQALPVEESSDDDEEDRLDRDKKDKAGGRRRSKAGAGPEPTDPLASALIVKQRVEEEKKLDEFRALLAEHKEKVLSAQRLLISDP
jgi:hypothetical protein